MAKKKRKPPPKCKALLLCDRIIVDRDTGRPSLIDVFTDVTLPGFPGTLEPFRIFLQIADGIGDYNLSLELCDLREDSIIARTLVAEVSFRERPQKLDLVISVDSLPLPHEGGYDLVMFADDQEIDRQRFIALVDGIGHGSE
jgi:hypothetical protein